MSSNFLKKTSVLLLIGFIVGLIFLLSLYKTSVFFSSDKSCMMCHVHPYAEESWTKSVHVNNPCGVKVHCVSCHLPPQEQTWAHYSAKAKLGIRDVWGYMTKDSADINWVEKSLLENAVKYFPNASCVDCHQNLFPKGVSPDGVTAHLYYENYVKKLDLQCISCHLDAGHANPNYKHGKFEGIGSKRKEPVDTTKFFREPAKITAFSDFTETIPGTIVSVSMKAIPGSNGYH